MMGMMKRRTAGGNPHPNISASSNTYDHAYNNNNNNNYADTYDYYVEDYGEFDADTKRSRRRIVLPHGGGAVAYGTGVSVVSGNPMICLRSFRRTFLNSVTFSVVSIASSFIAMQLVDSILVLISSTITIVVSVLVLFQRRKLKRLGTLQKQHNELRRQANYFIQERERLNRTLGRLDDKIASLSNVPTQLKKLGRQGTTNIDRLVTVVEQQQTVQDEIRTKIRQRVMQSILSVCVSADRDNNFELTPSEIDVLVSRLKLIEHVEFDEEQFRDAIIVNSDTAARNNNEDVIRKNQSPMTATTSMKSILKVVRCLIDKEDEYKLGKAVFRITLEK